MQRAASALQAEPPKVGSSIHFKEGTMHISRNEIPVKIDAPGAVARQADGFGDASHVGALAGEYFTLGAGADIAPLLQGLQDDACQAPHWGYVLTGSVVVTYTDGTEETCSAQDLFHWPAGHSVRVVEDADVVLFSPQAQHGAVLDHMLARMGGA
jgi:hypothetical protein